MDFTRKFGSHTICISDMHFGLTFHVRSLSSQISVNLRNFRKMPYLHGFQKMQKMFHGLGQDISCIKFLVVSDFEALLRCKRIGQSGSLWIAFKWGLSLGV